MGRPPKTRITIIRPKLRELDLTGRTGVRPARVPEVEGLPDIRRIAKQVLPEIRLPDLNGPHALERYVHVVPTNLVGLPRSGKPVGHPYFRILAMSDTTDDIPRRPRLPDKTVRAFPDPRILRAHRAAKMISQFDRMTAAVSPGSEISPSVRPWLEDFTTPDEFFMYGIHNYSNLRKFFELFGRQSTVVAKLRDIIINGDKGLEETIFFMREHGDGKPVRQGITERSGDALLDRNLRGDSVKIAYGTKPHELIRLLARYCSLDDLMEFMPDGFSVPKVNRADRREKVNESVIMHNAHSELADMIVMLRFEYELALRGLGNSDFLLRRSLWPLIEALETGHESLQRSLAYVGDIEKARYLTAQAVEITELAKRPNLTLSEFQWGGIAQRDLSREPGHDKPFYKNVVEGEGVGLGNSKRFKDERELMHAVAIVGGTFTSNLFRSLDGRLKVQELLPAIVRLRGRKFIRALRKIMEIAERTRDGALAIIARALLIQKTHDTVVQQYSAKFPFPERKLEPSFNFTNMSRDEWPLVDSRAYEIITGRPYPSKVLEVGKYSAKEDFMSAVNAALDLVPTYHRFQLKDPESDKAIVFVTELLEKHDVTNISESEAIKIMSLLEGIYITEDALHEKNILRNLLGYSSSLESDTVSLFDDYFSWKYERIENDFDILIISQTLKAFGSTMNPNALDSFIRRIADSASRVTAQFSIAGKFGEAFSGISRVSEVETKRGLFEALFFLQAGKHENAVDSFTKAYNAIKSGDGINNLVFYEMAELIHSSGTPHPSLQRAIDMLQKSHVPGSGLPNIAAAEDRIIERLNNYGLIYSDGVIEWTARLVAAGKYDAAHTAFQTTFTTWVYNNQSKLVSWLKAVEASGLSVERRDSLFLFAVGKAISKPEEFAAADGYEKMLLLETAALFAKTVFKKDYPKSSQRLVLSIQELLRSFDYLNFSSKHAYLAAYILPGLLDIYPEIAGDAYREKFAELESDKELKIYNGDDETWKRRATYYHIDRLYRDSLLRLFTNDRFQTDLSGSVDSWDIDGIRAGVVDYTLLEGRLLEEISENFENEKYPESDADNLRVAVYELTRHLFESILGLSGIRRTDTYFDMGEDFTDIPFLSHTFYSTGEDMPYGTSGLQGRKVPPPPSKRLQEILESSDVGTKLTPVQEAVLAGLLDAYSEADAAVRFGFYRSVFTSRADLPEGLRKLAVENAIKAGVFEDTEVAGKIFMHVKERPAEVRVMAELIEGAYGGKALLPIDTDLWLIYRRFVEHDRAAGETIFQDFFWRHNFRIRLALLNKSNPSSRYMYSLYQKLTAQNDSDMLKKFDVVLINLFARTRDSIKEGTFQSLIDILEAEMPKDKKRDAIKLYLDQIAKLNIDPALASGRVNRMKRRLGRQRQRNPNRMLTKKLDDK